MVVCTAHVETGEAKVLRRSPVRGNLLASARPARHEPPRHALRSTSTLTSTSLKEENPTATKKARAVVAKEAVTQPLRTRQITAVNQIIQKLKKLKKHALLYPRVYQ